AAGSAALRTLRRGRGAGLDRVRARQPDRVRTIGAATPLARAFAGGAWALGPARALRAGSERQRRQGQPDRNAAGRDHPTDDRVLPGWLVRGTLAAAPRAARATPSREVVAGALARAAPRARAAGDDRRRHGGALLLPPTRSRARPGPADAL